MGDLAELTARHDKVRLFLHERLNNWLADRGFTPNEIEAVRRPRVSATEFDTWPMGDILKRLEAVANVRGRGDFVEAGRADQARGQHPRQAAGRRRRQESFGNRTPALSRWGKSTTTVFRGSSPLRESNDFPVVIEEIAGLVSPVAKFFDDVLVLDPANPGATRARCDASGARALHRDARLRHPRAGRPSRSQALGDVRGETGLLLRQGSGRRLGQDEGFARGQGREPRGDDRDRDHGASRLHDLDRSLQSVLRVRAEDAGSPRSAGGRLRSRSSKSSRGRGSGTTPIRCWCRSARAPSSRCPG